MLVLMEFPLQAQKTYKYRVILTDKVGTEYVLDRPQDFLSQRALERRQRQQLPVDSTDLPVSRSYMEALKEVGMNIIVTSKWNNTAVVEVTDTLLMNRVEDMPFVLRLFQKRSATRRGAMRGMLIVPALWLVITQGAYRRHPVKLR